MRNLQISEDWVKPYQNSYGAFSFIVYNESLQEYLERLYGRPQLCVKAFRAEPQEPDGFLWGNNLLFDCTVIQNLFAQCNLAPRVYDIVLINEAHIAQVTRFCQGEDWHDSMHKQPVFFDREAARNLIVKKGIHVNWDWHPKNFPGGKLVDFQGFTFKNKGSYRDQLIQRAYQYAAWGSRPEPYQAITEWEVDGQRCLADRIKAMKLAEIDFEGKTILDIGCNLGNFCREAMRRGAKRAIGIDVQPVAELAYEVSSLLGHWNLDFLGLQLPQEQERIAECGLTIFDIVFILSADQQIGYAPWVAALTKDLLFFEGHVGRSQQREFFQPRLEKDFEVVEHLGRSLDHGPRHLFRCGRR